MSLKNTQSNKNKTEASSRSILEIGKGSFGKMKSLVKASSGSAKGKGKGTKGKNRSVAIASTGSATKIGKGSFGKIKSIVSINTRSMIKTISVTKYKIQHDEFKIFREIKKLGTQKKKWLFYVPEK